MVEFSIYLNRRVFVMDGLKISSSSLLKGTVYAFRVGNFVKVVLPPFLKGVYSKRKEFAPTGSKVFPFRVDPFSKRNACARKQAESNNSFLFVKLAEIYHV